MNDLQGGMQPRSVQILQSIEQVRCLLTCSKPTLLFHTSKYTGSAKNMCFVTRIATLNYTGKISQSFCNHISNFGRIEWTKVSWTEKPLNMERDLYDFILVRFWGSKFSTSVRLSHACFVTKSNNLLPIIWYHMKDNQSSFPTPTKVGGWCPLSPEICAWSDPLPLKNADFDQYLFITTEP